MTYTRDTGKARLPALPAVNAQDPSLRNWISAVAERLEVREGSRGNPYERAVTLRDLEAATAGLVQITDSGKPDPNAANTIPLGNGLSARINIDRFIESMRNTRLFRDLLKRVDDPTRFDDLASEIRTVLLRSIADEASKRGADIQRVDTKIEDVNRSLAMTVQEITAALGSNAAGIREVQASYVSSTEATATKVTQLESSLGNYYQDGSPGRVQLEEQLTTQANYVNGLRGQYTLKIQAGGALAGFGLAASEVNGVPESAFIINADKFAIVAPNYSGGLTFNPSANNVPFGVDANGIYLNTNVYVRGQMRVDTGGKTLADGLRGSLDVAAVGTDWSDNTARQAIWASLGKINSATDNNHLVIGDTVTISGTNFVETRYWAGSAWGIPGAIINGNLLVNGSVAAGKIDTRGLTIKDQAGNIIFGSGTGLDWDLISGSRKPQDGATRNVFRGNWVAGIAYTVGDIVLDSGNGWSAKADHNAAAGNKPPASGNGNAWWDAYTIKGDTGSSGIDGLSIIAPNTAHTIPAKSSGEVSVYTGSGTTIQVYEGATALDAVASLTTTNSQFTVGTPTVSGTSSITVGGVTFAGKTATVAQHSAMSTAGDLSVITYPITLRRANGTVVNLSCQQTITKSKAGAVGQGQVKGIAFLRSVSVSVDAPTGGSFASPTPTTAGWFDGVPEGIAPLWQSTRLFTSDGLSPQQATWTTPQKVASTTSVRYQFSLDNSIWSDAASIDSVYMRTGTSLDGGFSWNYSAGIKIKGEEGPAGEDGPAGPAVVVLTDRTPAFTSTDGVLDAWQENIVFTASVSGIESPTYQWSVIGAQTSPTALTGPTLTLTAAQFGIATSVIVKCTVNEMYSDQEPVHRLNKSTAAAGATVGSTLGHVTVNSTAFITEFADTYGWDKLSGGGEWGVIYNAGSVNGNALQIGNAYGDDQVWLARSWITIPFDPVKMYRIRARVWAYGGTLGQFFLGFEAFKANGSTVIARSGQEVTGPSGRSSEPMHWVAANGQVLPQDEWVELVGYVRGHGGYGSGELSPNPAAPVTMRYGTAYISPVFVANWQGMPGRVLMDYCMVEEVTYTPPNTQGNITPVNASTWIADGAIGNAQIANAAITSAKIQDAAITSAKIENASITSAKIGSLAVDQFKLANQSVSVQASASGNFTCSTTVTIPNGAVGTIVAMVSKNSGNTIPSSFGSGDLNISLSSGEQSAITVQPTYLNNEAGTTLYGPTTHLQAFPNKAPGTYTVTASFYSGAMTYEPLTLVAFATWK